MNGAIPIPIDLGHGRTTLISPEDAELTQYNWHLSRLRYAQTYNAGALVYLHRMILTRILGRTLESDEFCDHINGETLDNRRSNLRLTSPSENQWNRRARHDSISGVNGVTFLKNGSWRARIQRYGKTISLGRFASKEEAIQARQNAELELFGQFSPLVSRKLEDSQV